MRDGGDEYRGGGDGRLADLRRLASREDDALEMMGARLRRGQTRSWRGQARASCSGGVGEQQRGAGEASYSGGEQPPFFPKSFLLP
ncbi:hypothetical protein LR48_Vigan02g050000 [Vigna angularis]|uniref:Uncharacterized protein n=1 Tax=Phaseolus angularis TaxID=3914 RepID=A0A0L9TUW3_PHAAN|nr:hypothetical protein LR48_Vigan02g050000 [Vigna angularis]